jgi:hypothetical protein
MLNPGWKCNLDSVMHRKCTAAIVVKGGAFLSKQLQGFLTLLADLSGRTLGVERQNSSLGYQ